MGEEVTFGRFRFHGPSGRLWAGKKEVRLTAKAAAVLEALVARAEQPVTRKELFASIWGDSVVSDDVLTGCIQELRKAFGDDAKQPRFIETRHRRGYRFVARLSSSTVDATVGASPSPTRIVPRPPPVVVGRERELRELRACLDRAMSGERQVVFVTGEPGIGKTTIAEAFLCSVASADQLRIGQGRCIEHYGAGEAYLPLLEALTRLSREPGGEHLVDLLRQHAPTWLVQMPSLLSATELKALQRRSSRVARERMLRELADVIEAVTAKHPLVLWLEDLHWSDVSTLDWLAYMARRPEPARLLLLGTYRCAEVLARGHPLKAIKEELELHGRCRELALSLLNEEAIEEYLVRRFPPSVARANALGGLARLIYRRTDGSPLFVVNAIGDLLSRGALVERQGKWELVQDPEAVQVAIPDDVREMIARQLDRTTPQERRILDVASAAGAEFCSAVVAAAAGVAVDEADACCADLARAESFLTARGVDEWPDGTLSGRYGFRHALYQEVAYERLPAGRRVDLHRRIGRSLESAFGDRSGEVATELAMHFQRARDVDGAIRHLQCAGEVAIRRGAAREAVVHLTDALDLLKTLPQSPGRDQQELALQIALGPLLMAIKGFGAPEVEQVYARALELCERMGDSQLFRALWGLWQFRTNRAELDAARALGERLLALAQHTDDTGVVIEAHHALWCHLFFQGELLASRDHVAQGLALYDSDRHASLASVYGHHDPAVCGHSMGAWAFELLGEPEEATRHSQDAMELARKLGHPFSEIHALVFAAFLHRERGDWRVCRKLACEAAAVANQRDFVHLRARATVIRGWAMVRSGEIEDGIAQMQEGIAAVRRLGSAFLPYLLGCLGDGYATAGRVHAAIDIVDEALSAVEKTGERFYESELLRLRGELLLIVRPDDTEAEQCFRMALETACGQRARLLEIRAIGSLRTLLDRQGRGEEVRRLAAGE